MRRTCETLTLAAGVAGMAAGWSRQRRMNRQIAHAGSRAREMTALASEQTALRRIATLAAGHASIADVCEEVARSATELFGAELGIVARFHGDGRAVVEGRFCADVTSRLPLRGREIAYREGSALSWLWARGETVRLESGRPSWSAQPLGERIATPIKLADELWGGLVIASPHGRTLPAGSEDRLEAFTDLVALAIANAHSREALVAQAMTDSLTGLANHRAFSRRLDQEIARAERHERPLTLVTLDIDAFKAINDTFGHLTGDLVLTQVAESLESAVRREATVARTGGDEFVLILPETDHAQAMELCARVTDSVGDAVHAAHRPVSISAGAAEFESGMGAAALRERADEALYAAKRGRDVSSRPGALRR